MRRNKSTTYGEKGGVGPTRGKKASRYEATMPDGRRIVKSSFKIHDDVAIASYYVHGGVYYIAGIVSKENPPAWAINGDHTEARRIG